MAHKFVERSKYADPEIAMTKILQYACAFEPVQDGRIYIEKINGPFLFEAKGSPAEYWAGLQLAIERGYLVMHTAALA
jgi:hypothetical protein